MSDAISEPLLTNQPRSTVLTVLARLRHATCGSPLRMTLSSALVVLMFMLWVWTRPTASTGPQPDQKAAPGIYNQDDCLRTIDRFLLKQPRQTFLKKSAGLMQTFGPNSFGGGPCEDDKCKLVEPCPNYQQTPHCRYDVYDNALASIYLTKRGKLDEARLILDAFVQLLYPQLPQGGGASDRPVLLLAASYTDAPARAGSYQGEGVADGAVDTGNNAWVGMAFAHFASASGEECYASVARDILDELTAITSCDDKLGGFVARLPPYPHFYRSTEHNTDMYALSEMLSNSKAAAQARSFVHGMFNQSAQAPSTYATGTADAKKCDPAIPLAPVAVDTVFWNLLASVDPVPSRKQAAVDFALKEARGEAGLVGLWSADEDRIGGNGWEGTG